MPIDRISKKNYKESNKQIGYKQKLVCNLQFGSSNCVPFVPASLFSWVWGVNLSLVAFEALDPILVSWNQKNYFSRAPVYEFAYSSVTCNSGVRIAFHFFPTSLCSWVWGMCSRIMAFETPEPILVSQNQIT